MLTDDELAKMKGQDGVEFVTYAELKAATDADERATIDARNTVDALVASDPSLAYLKPVEPVPSDDLAKISNGNYELTLDPEPRSWSTAPTGFIAPLQRGCAKPLPARTARRAPVIALRDESGLRIASALSVAEAGFSLHAATTASADDARAREALCKYVLRPPLAQERLRLLDDGLVRIELKRPFSDGTARTECRCASGYEGLGRAGGAPIRRASAGPRSRYAERRRAVNCLRPVGFPPTRSRPPFHCESIPFISAGAARGWREADAGRR